MNGSIVSMNEIDMNEYLWYKSVDNKFLLSFPFYLLKRFILFTPFRNISYDVIKKYYLKIYRGIYFFEKEISVWEGNFNRFARLIFHYKRIKQRNIVRNNCNRKSFDLWFKKFYTIKNLSIIWKICLQTKIQVCF